jgi:excisionase family DNA binding protein
MSETTGDTLSVREAAVLLQVGLPHIYQLIYSQKLPATKAEHERGGWRIPRQAVADYAARLGRSIPELER